MCRLSRFTAPGKNFDMPRLILLVRMEQTRRGIDLHKRHAFRDGKRDDRKLLEGLPHEIDPDRQCGMRSRFGFSEGAAIIDAVTLDTLC